ncbi:hypothetical protein [Streptomyces macrosporus]|uniref:hypothetical protein n=1 Tax=Streptomyces macrosporus TaxID=44032 RepID=UPI0031D90C10
MDSTGKRGRLLRRVGWALGAACACYAVILVVSMAGGSSAAPWLLIPGPQGETAETVEVVPSPSTSRTPGPADGTAEPSASASPDATEPSVPGTLGGTSPERPSGAPTGSPTPGGTTGDGGVPAAPRQTAGPGTGGTEDDGDSVPEPARPSASPEPTDIGGRGDRGGTNGASGNANGGRSVDDVSWWERWTS